MRRGGEAPVLVRRPTVLKLEKRFIFTVVAQAQCAAEYLHGLQTRQAEEDMAAA